VIGVGDHWLTTLRVLHGLHPAFDSARMRDGQTSVDGRRTAGVVKQAALWIEVFVGQRPSIEITREALSVFRQGPGRPPSGIRSRTAVLRDLFMELGLPTSTDDFASQVSRLLKDL
jgi:hypothetical protein